MARRTRVSFERSKSYTCDFDSAPCLTMTAPHEETLIAQSPYRAGGVSRVLSC
jgi:hypothetical protein